MDQRTIPDARWINRELDIRRVATELGIQGAGTRFHCWHPENHRNGDADASVGYWSEGNRLRCFVCELAASSVLDLVIDVKRVDVGNAISWVAKLFDVPEIPARKPHEHSEHRRIDAVTDPITFLVRSHIFSRLSTPARLLAPVFAALSEKDGSSEAPRLLAISYRALMRYSGLKSPNSVSRGIEELKVIGWMRGGSERAGLVQTTAAYVVTPFASAIIELGNSLAKEEQVLIEHERQQSRLKRQTRERMFVNRVRIEPKTKLSLLGA